MTSDGLVSRPWPSRGPDVAVASPVFSAAMRQGDDPRIVLRDPVGVADRIVSRPDQPGQYVDERGNWEQTDQSANWQRVEEVELRVYDLIEPTTG